MGTTIKYITNMKTRSIGEILRTEREKKHLSLDRLSVVTSIPIQKIQYLELNQFELLPSAPYVRGYLRTIARELNLDPEPLISILRRDYKESARGELLPRELLQPPAPKFVFSTRVNVAVIMVISVVGVMVGYGLIQAYLASLPPRLVVTQPAQYQVVAATVVVEGSTNPDTSVVINDQPAMVNSVGGFKGEVVYTTQGLQAINVEVTDRRGQRNQLKREVIVEF